MSEMTEQLRDYGLIPVVTITDPGKAEGLGNALLEGGLPVAEITFRSDVALESIKRIVKASPGLCVGAGTVLSVGEAQAARDAGVAFIVTPGFSHQVVEWCLREGIPVYPGVSGTEGIEAARSLGLSTVKFFPAEAAGGVAMLKALSAPYREISFMPTGGIGLGNVNAYLALSCVVACGGSWLAPSSAIAAGDFAAVTSAVRRSLRAVYGCTVSEEGLELGVPDIARTKAYLRRLGITADTSGGTSGGTSGDDSIRIDSVGVTIGKQ
jgi:2-dehydro-3-deoxyphosphogluconate aldolase/(4S)-4-hydroxy-2-oxoglutarate aldolase